MKRIGKAISGAIVSQQEYPSTHVKSKSRLGALRMIQRANVDYESQREGTVQYGNVSHSTVPAVVGIDVGVKYGRVTHAQTGTQGNQAKVSV